MPDRDPGHPATRRVLVADDEPHIRRILQFLLEQDGFEVHLVGDGEEAWKAVANFHPSGGWKVLTGLGVERKTGGGGDKLLFRIGGAYEFHVGSGTISPTVAAVALRSIVAVAVGQHQPRSRHRQRRGHVGEAGCVLDGAWVAEERC